MPDPALVKKIQEVLTQAEPYIAGHGGHISFIGWDETTGVVEVSLEGSCESCSLSQITLKYGLEEALRREIPQVREVRPV